MVTLLCACLLLRTTGPPACVRSYCCPTPLSVVILLPHSPQSPLTARLSCSHCLPEFYKKVKGSPAWGKDFEIVFVSSDISQSEVNNFSHSHNNDKNVELCTVKCSINTVMALHFRDCDYLGVLKQTSLGTAAAAENGGARALTSSHVMV